MQAIRGAGLRALAVGLVCVLGQQSWAQTEAKQPEAKPTVPARPFAMLGVGAIPSADGKGLDVMAVAPDSPAAKAGIQPGDRILSIDKTEINSLPDLRRVIREKKAGDKIDVVIRRADKEQTLQPTLVEHPRFAGPMERMGPMRERMEAMQAGMERMHDEVLKELRDLRKEVEDLKSRCQASSQSTSGEDESADQSE
jgi:C-terminal processing protease CtpA/Prc